MTGEQIADELELKRSGLSKLARRRAEAAHFHTGLLVDSLRALEQARTGSELRIAADNYRVRTELAIRLLYEALSCSSELVGAGMAREVLDAVWSEKGATVDPLANAANGTG